MPLREGTLALVNNAISAASALGLLSCSMLTEIVAVALQMHSLASPGLSSQSLWDLWRRGSSPVSLFPETGGF